MSNLPNSPWIWNIGHHQTGHWCPVTYLQPRTLPSSTWLPHRCLEAKMLITVLIIFFHNSLLFCCPPDPFSAILSPDLCPGRLTFTDCNFEFAFEFGQVEALTEDWEVEEARVQAFTPPCFVKFWPHLFVITVSLSSVGPRSHSIQVILFPSLVPVNLWVVKASYCC